MADNGGPRASLLLGATSCGIAAAYGAKALDVRIRRRNKIDPTITQEHVLEDEAISLAD